MTVLELGAIGEFVGSFAVIASLIYLALQIRQSTSQQKREETVSIQHGQNTVVSLMQDPAVVRAYVKTADGDTSASVTDQARAIIWVIQYLNHFQIVFDLHAAGSLDDDRYDLWKSFAVSIVASKGIRAWWDDESGKFAFMANVRDLIDENLDDTEKPPVPFNKMWNIFRTEAWRDAD